jgi:hypothetical protein
LPIAANEFSCIEHLVINSKVLINQLDSLLSYIPHIHRLSFGHLYAYENSQTNRSSIMLNYLTDVSLTLSSVSLDDLEPIIADFFHQVQVLRVTSHSSEIFGYRMGIFNADRWEQLISIHMPNLCIFDFEHQCRILFYDNDRLAYETQVNKFNSLFWTKRHWFFKHQYYRTRYLNNFIFFSINSYR